MAGTMNDLLSIPYSVYLMGFMWLLGLGTGFSLAETIDTWSDHRKLMKTLEDKSKKEQ